MSLSVLRVDERGPSGTKFHLPRPDTGMGTRPLGRAIFKQDAIEIRAPYLIGIRPCATQRLAKIDRP